MVKAFAVIALASALVPAAQASPRAGFSFGRIGGNIRPFTVTITADGHVRVTGSATVGRTLLTKAQLATLRSVSTANRFGAIPAVTGCPKTSPDVAATFVRVAGRTVRVHGACVARYQRIWAALSTAVQLR